MHRHLLHNWEIRDTRENLVSPGQVGLLNGWGVFSTLRVKQGVLFAWERHVARMKKDAALMHVPFPDDSGRMLAGLGKLVEANQAENSTLRVAVIRNTGGMFDGPAIERPYDIIAFTKDLVDWTPGVRLMTTANARHSNSPFAGTKILSWSMNLTWLEQARQAGFDEMLLLDDRGNVSECTSANIFAVFGNEVRTPPLASGCLPGITRAILLEEIHVDGIRVVEQPLTPAELGQADAVFITSSTRDLLQVGVVDSTAMGTSAPVRDALNRAMQEYIDAYVANAKRQATTVPV